MSTARPPRSHQQGFTFLEVTVVVALVALISTTLLQAVDSTSDTATYLEGVRRCIERTERVTYEIRGLVGTTHSLFQRDERGLGYLDALDLSGLPPRPGSRLPLIDEATPLRRDEPGDEATGNMLLVSWASDPVPCVANPTTRKVLSIDVYHLACVFAVQTDRTLRGMEAAAHDLVIWRSVGYPSQVQLTRISNTTERRNVVLDLYGRYGYDYAWDPGLPVAGAFFPLNPTGTLGTTPEAQIEILEDERLSERGRLVYGDLQLARTDAHVANRRSLLTADDPAVWRPDGFEVKVSTMSGNRQVWMRLVTETPAGLRRVASHGVSILVSAQDS